MKNFEVALTANGQVEVSLFLSGHLSLFLKGSEI
jgi:hypothetical protein